MKIKQSLYVLQNYKTKQEYHCWSEGNYQEVMEHLLKYFHWQAKDCKLNIKGTRYIKE